MVEIVAEISGNHRGSLFNARELIKAAAGAGCDYAKFQFYRPTDMPDFNANAVMYTDLCVPSAWLPTLFETALDCSIGLFASVFSVRAAKEILQYDVPYIKLASPESTPLPMEVYQEISDWTSSTTTRLIVSGSLVHAELPARYRLFCPFGHPQRIGPHEKEEYQFEPLYNGFSDHTEGITDPLWFCDHPKTQSKI